MGVMGRPKLRDENSRKICEGVRLTRGLWTELKEFSKEVNIPNNHIIQLAVEEFLAKNKKKNS